MDRNRPDLRLGRRVQVDPIPVQWRVPAPGERRRLFRRRPQEGTLVDLSVSGLLVHAPPADDVSVGHLVHIQVGDAVGPVRIRRIAPVPGSDLWAYGLQLAEPEGALTSTLVGELDRRSAVRASQWHGRPPGTVDL